MCAWVSGRVGEWASGRASERVSESNFIIPLRETHSDMLNLLSI